MMMYRRDGGKQCRNCLTQMSDEQIAKLTLPELIELIKRFLEEVEVRAMEVS